MTATHAATIHVLLPAEPGAPEDAISEVLNTPAVLDWAYADGGDPRPVHLDDGEYVEGAFLHSIDPHASYRFEFAGSPRLEVGEHITVHRPDLNARYRITARQFANGRRYYHVLFICAEGHWSEGDTEPACDTLSLAEALFYANTTGIKEATPA